MRLRPIVLLVLAAVSLTACDNVEDAFVKTDYRSPPPAPSGWTSAAGAQEGYEYTRPGYGYAYAYHQKCAPVELTAHDQAGGTFPIAGAVCQDGF